MMSGSRFKNFLEFSKGPYYRVLLALSISSSAGKFGPSDWLVLLYQVTFLLMEHSSSSLQGHAILLFCCFVMKGSTGEA